MAKVNKSLVTGRVSKFRGNIRVRILVMVGVYVTADIFWQIEIKLKSLVQPRMRNLSVG